MLTVAISIANGVDALFSMLPLAFQGWKLGAEQGLVVLLLRLNLRGVKESIRVLLPIFLGFVATHALLIVYGVGVKTAAIPALLPDTLRETTSLAGQNMACSLAFTAGGIILLYLLWNAAPQDAQTLNAVAFRAIPQHAGFDGPLLGSVLTATLACQAGPLLVAANTGFLGRLPASWISAAATASRPRHASGSARTPSPR